MADMRYVVEAECGEESIYILLALDAKALDVLIGFADVLRGAVAASPYATSVTFRVPTKMDCLAQSWSGIGSIDGSLDADCEVDEIVDSLLNDGVGFGPYDFSDISPARFADIGDRHVEVWSNGIDVAYTFKTYLKSCGARVRPLGNVFLRELMELRQRIGDDVGQ